MLASEGELLAARRWASAVNSLTRSLCHTRAHVAASINVHTQAREADSGNYRLFEAFAGCVRYSKAIANHGQHRLYAPPYEHTGRHRLFEGELARECPPNAISRCDGHGPMNVRVDDAQLWACAERRIRVAAPKQ